MFYSCAYALALVLNVHAEKQQQSSLSEALKKKSTFNHQEIDSFIGDNLSLNDECRIYDKWIQMRVGNTISEINNVLARCPLIIKQFLWRHFINENSSDIQRESESFPIWRAEK